MIVVLHFSSTLFPGFGMFLFALWLSGVWPLACFMSVQH
jgi:hypothetical protein